MIGTPVHAEPGQLRARVRQTIAANLSTFLKEARQELELLNERARRLGNNGLIVIFDSLEKLRGISTNWHEVLASAEQTFAGGAPYLRLPVHVVYTVPAALVARQLAQVQFIPMIKLHTRESEDCQPGIDAARELIRRRVPDAALRELLGPEADNRLLELIRWSGGYPHEIVRLLQSALGVPDLPLADSDLDRIVNEVRDSYRKIVPADAFDWLAHVAIDQYMTIQNDGQRQAADLMLSNNAVLRYLNDRDWFDLHPAVAQIPGVQDARQALESQRKRNGVSPM